MINVLFVCLGNICRSPLAEGLFKKQVNEVGLNEQITCDSAGTASYHLGQQPDKRMVSTALEQDVKLNHKAKQFSKADFNNFDYIVVMDESNYNNVMKLKPTKSKAKVVFMRNYDEYVLGVKEVPDPYYGSMEDFKTCYYILESCCKNFLKEIIESKGLKLENSQSV
jgi:protein-tyrosine phosphatase